MTAVLRANIATFALSPRPPRPVSSAVSDPEAVLDVAERRLEIAGGEGTV